MSGKQLFKILLAAIAIMVFTTIVGMVTCGGIFNDVYKIEPTNVWKPMTAPPPMYYLGSFVMNFIFAAVYVILRRGVPGKNIIVKGIVYGLCIWATGQLVGMFSMYVFMTVAPQVLLYWTISGLIITPIMGIIAAAICGK